MIQPTTSPPTQDEHKIPLSELAKRMETNFEDGLTSQKAQQVGGWGVVVAVLNVQKAFLLETTIG